MIGEVIENYEKRLREAWETSRNALLDGFELDLSVDKADEEKLVKLGMKLYQEVNQLNLHIRPYVCEHYITGSFHILANYAPPKVGWHPNFEQLSQIIRLKQRIAMLPWSERPIEVATLLNPAFCAVLLRDAIEAYEYEQIRVWLIPLPFSSCPLFCIRTPEMPYHLLVENE